MGVSASSVGGYSEARLLLRVLPSSIHVLQYYYVQWGGGGGEVSAVKPFSAPCPKPLTHVW